MIHKFFHGEDAESGRQVYSEFGTDLFSNFGVLFKEKSPSAVGNLNYMIERGKVKRNV